MIQAVVLSKTVITLVTAVYTYMCAIKINKSCNSGKNFVQGRLTATKAVACYSKQCLVHILCYYYLNLHNNSNTEGY